MMKRLTSILLALLMLVGMALAEENRMMRCWAIGTA